jgi:membrane protease subunit HflC
MRNLIVVAILALVLLATSSIFVVKEPQVGVLFQLGRIVRTDIGPGIHFKLPLVQDARVFDRRILTLDAQPERYLTSEKKDVNVDFFAKWRIKDVGRFYTTTSGDELQAAQRLTPILKEALRNQITQRTLRETVSDARSSMTAALVENANDAAQTLGIEVVDVRIKRIDLPEEVSESVYNRMRAERARVANELRSQGTEASEEIRANANRERQVILAEAERDAQRLRGEGDARASQLYAEAYGRDAEFYGFYRSLEAYRRAFADGEGVLVLDPDSEFFRYFEEAGRGE